MLIKERVELLQVGKRERQEPVDEHMNAIIYTMWRHITSASQPEGAHRPITFGHSPLTESNRFSCLTARLQGVETLCFTHFPYGSQLMRFIPAIPLSTHVRPD